MNKKLIILLAVFAVCAVLLVGGVVAAKTLLNQEIFIVLTWGKEPKDLDLVLTGTVPGSDDPFTLNWDVRELSGYAMKDIDDRSSYGPETITITKRFDAPVVCSVRLFDRDSIEPDTLVKSGATVRVLRGGKVRATFEVDPSQTLPNWNVFQLMPNGKIKTLNTYDDTLFK